MEDAIVTVRTFNHETEAFLFSSRLEHEGIECFIADNNITAVNPFLSNAVGGIKVNIRSSDLERAEKLLQEIEEEINNQPQKSEKIKVGSTIFSLTDGYCPKCESDAVYVKNFDILKLTITVFAALLYLPSPFKNEMICKDCLHRWKKY